MRLAGRDAVARSDACAQCTPCHSDTRAILQDRRFRPSCTMKWAELLIDGGQPSLASAVLPANKVASCVTMRS